MPSSTTTALILTLYLWISIGFLLGGMRLDAADQTQQFKLLRQYTNDDINNELTIYPSELPTYTGWARPEKTMVAYYSIIGDIHTTVSAGSDWNVTIGCAACDESSAHFYVRIYGPSVASGVVLKDNHTYTIQVTPIDPGRYFVEVVLAFSDAPEFDAFPLASNQTEPAYEGHMVPGFPVSIEVVREAEPYHDRPETKHVCSLQELLEQDDDPNGRAKTARWVVVDKVSSVTHPQVMTDTMSPPKVSLEGYQESQNSLGIWMDYVPRMCILLPLPQRAADNNNCLSNSTTTAHPIHVIFVGDSNLRLQSKLFAKVTGLHTTLVSTSNGIVCTYDNVTAELTAIARSNMQERRYVLFNTGLHDISQLCTQAYADKRREYMDESRLASFSCTAEYRKMLTKLVDFVSHYPAELRVFQSTTAGWMKWGNYGFAWPPSEPQPFPFSPNFVAHMNELAYNMIHQHNQNTELTSHIDIMDGYWITLSRPDNREVNIDNVIGKHMVHPGNEVLRALVRIWYNILLHAVSSECVD